MDLAAQDGQAVQSPSGALAANTLVMTPEEAAPAPAPTAAVSSAAGGTRLRRGLPRVPGGRPWPVAPDASVAAEPAPAATPAVQHVSPRQAAFKSVPAATPSVWADGAGGMRRGLPRVAGGESWPSAGITVLPERVARDASPAPVDPAPESVASPAEPAETVERVEPDRGAPAAAAVPTPAPGKRPRPERQRLGPFTWVQWVGVVILGGAALVVAASLAVMLVRWFLSTSPGQDFVAAYPGESHLPEGAPVGLPAWIGWQHFFNVFLMVLIIRTGLTIRTETRPKAYWAPRGNPTAKTSLNVWFHQALDVLWLVNGVVFVVLLFATGQWMRIVPTSWEVFPNAISAALQYVSLDWPTDNGWVNYNGLQQLAYFTTVFVAAPLAAVTGVRMSAVWPKKNARLTKAYPVEWARRIHFPVMLYFVVFIFIHVALVFATGALRNLNHMYAAQGSTDAAAYADNWTGFWMFVVSLAVIAAAWVAARPLMLAPIARLFGTVSGR